MDFNRAMAKSVAWISTSMAVIAAISATKNPCCLFAFILPLFVGLQLLRDFVQISELVGSIPVKL